jgi:hypothetical protein
MFVGDEVLLDVDYAHGLAALRHLTGGGVLFRAARDAYNDGSTGTVRVGVPGISKLVQIHVHQLSGAADSGGLAIRWEATGPGGGLFPVLDADLHLVPAGDGLTRLTLSGAYRPPLGPLGELLDRTALRRLATATIRNFITRVAGDITGRSDHADAPAFGDSPSLPPARPG